MIGMKISIGYNAHWILTDTDPDADPLGKKLPEKKGKIPNKLIRGIRFLYF